MSEAAVIDFASMETPTLDAPVETPESPVEETPVETPETPEETPADGTGAPEAPPAGKPPTLKAVRDAVKAFEQTNPELGKHLKALLDNEGRIRAYQGEFPDVESARTLKAAVEAAGGIEGLTKLTELQDYVDNINAQWDSGDPEALEAIFENGGEGAVKMLPHYLNRVEKVNPEAFGAVIKPHLVRNLEGAGFNTVVGGILRVLAGSGTPEQKLENITESVQSMAQWFDSQKREAEKTNLDTLEPERNKLKDEWGKVTSEKQKIFEGEVQTDVKPAINQTFAQHMRAYLQHDTRPDAAKQDIARAWITELGKALEKDQKQVQGMIKAKSRNKQAIVNFMKTRISAVAPGVTEKIVKTYNLKPGKAAPKPAGGGKEPETPQTGVGSVSSPIRVKDKPADSNIDWEADPDRMHFIAGKAKLLTGPKQWVRWRG